GPGDPWRTDRGGKLEHPRRGRDGHAEGYGRFLGETDGLRYQPVSRRTGRHRSRRRSRDVQLRGGGDTRRSGKRVGTALERPNPGLTTPRVGGRAKWPSHFGRDTCAIALS